MRPLDKIEYQKTYNSTAHDYSNCNDDLKHVLGGMIIAMEKFQIEEDSLDVSNNVLRNKQNNDSVSNTFQDIARSYKGLLANGTNVFNKNPSVAAKTSNHIDMPCSKAFKCNQGKDSKTKRNGSRSWEFKKAILFILQ